MAAIAELHRRRTAAEDVGDLDYRILSAQESVTEEVAAALTITSHSAATLVHLAERLTGPLAATGAALEAGRIDLARARVICDVTDDLPDHATELVEAAALERASDQTTGQLRRRIKRIAQRLAPESIEERKREAVRRRRMELWENPSGTADLALCDLAVEDAHAIYNKITAVAHGLKTDGDTRTLNAIRVDLATRLLQGVQLPDATRDLLTKAYAVGTQAAGAGEALAGHRSGHECCEGGGDTDRARVDAELASLANIADELLVEARGRVRPQGRQLAVGRAAQRIHHRLAAARDLACQGEELTHGRPGYRPPARMRREVEARHATCVFPTCNQPSHRCDLDHTVPWQPGITCRCNLAPLCRRHHRLKQRPDWKLFQIWPGLLIWVTPSGAWHIVRPDRQ
ncbi:HNH endonuclease signature motif containing protein [Actinomadura madurae]|uniref:HNH endonuclease signature motif containing protein n=1 Tax=Actinomadura madurae TaxID=1993 RepID=UPI000944888E|nr:HNH endonuclease signature motif containing protein [Actinomadura madurae]